MKKIWTIAKWEFLERVKNRLFIITLLIAPLLVLAVGTAAGLLAETNQNYTKVVGISTENHKHFNIISTELESIFLPDGQPAFITVMLKDSEPLASGSVDCLIIIRENLSSLSIHMSYGFTLSPLELNKIENSVKLGLTKSVLQNSELPQIIFETKMWNGNSNSLEDFNQLFFTGFAFLFLLIVVIIYSGSNFARALAEEKNTHINEILLSSVSANEILFGKYIGLILLGLVQTIFWFSISFIFFEGSSFNFEITSKLPLLIIYFFLGYLFYSAIFLALGAQVSTENEAQQITTLTSLFLLIPVMLAGHILVSPDSFLSTVITFFPLTTSPVMLMKINITELSLFEIILTIITQLISILAVIFIASNYFAKGLTQFNKRKRR